MKNPKCTIIQSANEITANSSWPFDHAKASTVAFINHYSLFILRKNQIAVDEFDFVFTDGLLLSWQMTRKFKKNVPRISFDLGSIARPWINSAVKKNANLIFAGSSREESKRFEKWFFEQNWDSDQRKISAHFIDGYRPNVVGDISAAIDLNEFNFIVIGLGTPLQERVVTSIKKIMDRLGARGVAITCGGFLTQTASVDGRHGLFYPNWINKLNLRWIYRCWRQPYVIKRIIFIYPLSYIMVARDE